MSYFAQGKVGELRAAQKLIEGGYEVYFPMLEGGVSDLIAIKGSKVLKIQVKSGSIVNGTVTVYLQKQRNHNTEERYHRYTLEEVDYFAQHVIDTDEVLWVKNADVADKSILTIRKEVPKNNQTKGINLFENFTLLP